MTIFVCLDDNGGMLFHHRRQSRDHVVTDCLTNTARERALWMSRYSAAMFEDASPFHIDDAYHEHMSETDACFVEDGVLDIAHADELIVYRWNRRYPADRRFPTDVLADEWELVSTRDAVGSSHDRITEEHYRKKE